MSDRDSTTTQRRTIRPHDYVARSQPTSSACLVVLQGVRLGQRIDVGEQALIIGRAPECDFQIMERSVSRQHARIWRGPAGYRIKDLDSTNKTLVNDQPIIEAELRDGDHVTIGSCVLKFMDRSSIEARYHEEIYQLATVDPLTGLYNRRQFLELLEKELARSANHRRPLTLLIIDLDHFKSINDRFGHPVGDVVLKRVATALQGNAREEFIIARIGGEEFAVVLPEHGVEAAAQFAGRLCDAVGTLDMANSQIGPQRVTVSIGVAPWQQGMANVSDLMRAADLQLYRAKQSGRNRVCAVGSE
ncbi:MAG: GGDEF domain-containing protein [Dokdonella sp.]